MRFSQTLSLSALAACLLAPSVAAQVGDAPAISQEGATSTEAAEPDMSDEDTIIVLGARLIGQVQAPQPPLLELGEADIAAYGAGSIAELIQALGPQVNSARGRGGGFPVILVNGVRIGSFRELRSYPPEAIERFEVFPEEVALQYGYSADQRVINVILKDNFSSQELELEYGQPFDGGFSTQEAEGTYLRIDGDARLNVNLGWNNSSALSEAERGVVQADAPDLATDPDPAAFRSLVADSAGLEGTVNWSTKLGPMHSLSLNTTYERDDRLRLQGLDTVLLTDPGGTSVLRTFNAADPLAVDSRTETLAAAGTLNLKLGDWEATTTLDASRARSVSRIERRVDTAALVAAAAAGTLDIEGDLGTFANAGSDEARTRTTSASALSTLRGSPFYLPAGDVNLTLDAGYDWDRIESEDTRNPGPETLLKRGNLSAGANISLPLTSRRDDVLAAIGDITFNASAGIDHLSDFGTLFDWNLGLTWGVTETLTFTVTHVNRDAAPSLAQLGNPEIATPNVPVFDLATNETVLVTVLSGGNPLLPAQNQSDWKLGVQWELPFLDNATVSLDYLRNSSSDVAAAFPLLTPEIEAAFPGRVIRDGNGRLVQIDQRPVTYAARDEERLQFGLNLSGQIGANEGQGGGSRAGAPGGAGGGGPAAMAGGGFGGGGFGGGGQGTPSGAPGGFRPNPEAFAQMRATFCEADPQVLRGQLNQAIAAAASGAAPPVGENGQPLTIPPQMLQRLAGDDGVIGEAEFATIRTRFCSAGGPGAPGSQGGGFAAGGPPAGAGAGGPPAGTGGGGGPGGMRGLPFGRGPGGSGSSGRWFVNLQYTLELQNDVLIAPGLPVLDLLDGDALAGGGQAKHSGTFRVGMFHRGFGMIWDGRYTGSSTVDGTGLPGSTDLAFDDYMTLDVRVFADLGAQDSIVAAVPFLAGTRISFDVENIFDARQRVTDSAGIVPLRYQPFLIDPVGRTFEIELRKLF